jgi:ferritin-like metal-binding protein YciE
MPLTKDKKKLPLIQIFTEGIHQLYWIEKHTADIMPDMIEGVTSKELRNALSDYLDLTRIHVSRLNEIFGLIREKSRDMKCRSITSMLKEAESIVGQTEDGSSIRDVALIMINRKMIHYQISYYGNMLLFARPLSLSEVYGLLNITLNEEREAKDRLSDILSHLNYEIYV